MSGSRERGAQKARTREALLAGARSLIGAGRPVTVAAAAAAAGISKATAYRYFSDPQAMAAEAGLALTVRPYEEIVEGAASPRARAEAVSRYFLELALAHEPAFRQFLARSLDASLADGAAVRARRGARRVAMFEAALEGERPRLGPAAMRRLVGALSTATGAEALIALRDVAGLEPDAARAAAAEATAGILDRFGVVDAP